MPIKNQDAYVDQLSLLSVKQWEKAMTLPVVEQDSHTFVVQGTTDFYTVTVFSDTYNCPCESFMYRKACSHIGAVAILRSRKRVK